MTKRMWGGRFSGTLDPRIDAACVSAWLGSLENVWHEPIDRNVFGLLERFGGADSLVSKLGYEPVEYVREGVRPAGFRFGTCHLMLL